VSSSRWPVKQAAIVLGIEPTKVSQSMRPAIRKVALLMLANAELTMAELATEMAVIRHERAELAEDRRRLAIATERLGIGG